MAKNYIQPGEVLDVTLAATIASGAGLLIGKRLGVVLSDGVSGDIVSTQVKGVFNLPKLSTDVVAQGDLLYWDDTNKRLTKTTTSNTLAGYAAAAAGNGVTTVNLHLNA